MAVAPSIIINLPGYPYENFPSVETVDDLRALASVTLAEGDNYVVDGEITSGDGGGGVFSWNDSSTADDDGATVVKPTDTPPLSAGRWILTGSDVVSDSIAALAEDDGATKIGTPDGTVQAVLDDIVADLAATTSQAATAYNKLLKKKYLIDDYIPQNLWADIAAHTNTTPLDAYFAAAAAELEGTTLIVDEGNFTLAQRWDLLGRTAYEIRGGNPQGTLINATFLDNEIIDVGSASAGVLSGAHIHGIGFNNPAARNTGAAIRIRNMTTVCVENFWMGGQAIGVEVGTQANNCTVGGAGISRIVNPKSTTGLGVLVKGGTVVLLQHLLIEGNQSTEALGGIKLQDGSDINIDRCWTTFSRDGLIIDPGVGETVQQVFSFGNKFDTGVGSGIVLRGSGVISEVESTKDWCSTNGARGVWLKTGPTIRNVDFSGTKIYNNAQEGFLAENCTSPLSLTEARVAGNSTSGANINDGIRITAGVTMFGIKDCFSGQNGQFVNSQRYGCRIDAGNYQRYMIQGNDFSDNSTGGLSDAGTATVIKSVVDNIP